MVLDMLGLGTGAGRHHSAHVAENVYRFLCLKAIYRLQGTGTGNWHTARCTRYGTSSKYSFLVEFCESPSGRDSKYFAGSEFDKIGFWSELWFKEIKTYCKFFFLYS